MSLEWKLIETGERFTNETIDFQSTSERNEGSRVRVARSFETRRKTIPSPARASASIKVSRLSTGPADL